MPGVATVYRWELFKLRFQKRTYLGLGAAIIVPILFVIAIRLQHHHDRGGDFAFSSYLTRSGLAVPLVILLFGAVWMFPLITALVAGDIFASEDHNGTLKTILTRSLERWQLFTGKALAASTYAVIAILLVEKDSILFIQVAPPVAGGALFASAAERAYIVLGCLIGAAGAPLQAASRSLLIRLAPKDRIAQFFGLFALTGKVTSFTGPLLIGIVTAATASQKAGMAVLVVFFVTGLALLGRVRV